MKTYIIINTVDLTQPMLDSCFQTLDSIRKSVNKQKAILSYSGDQPECLAGYQEYTKTQMLVIVHTEEWEEQE